MRRILPGLVALLHEAGCLVTMEGVETETEVLIAMDTDADLVQGYYFARPSPDPIADPNNPPALATLGRHFRELSTLEASRQRDDLTHYLNAFSSAVGAVRDGTQSEAPAPRCWPCRAWSAATCSMRKVCRSVPT